MLVLYYDQFEGLRLLDENKDPIVDRVWSDSSFGEWSELQEIPEGLHIIGLKANLVENDFITDLTFLLSPRLPDQL